jgi:hypothetical protein
MGVELFLLDLSQWEVLEEVRDRIETALPAELALSVVI